MRHLRFSGEKGYLLDGQMRLFIRMDLLGLYEEVHVFHLDTSR
jgi:hypothetical protein